MSNFDKKADSSAGNIMGDTPSGPAASSSRTSGVIPGIPAKSGKQVKPPRPSPPRPLRSTPSTPDADDLVSTLVREEDDDKESERPESGEVLRTQSTTDPVPASQSPEALDEPKLDESSDDDDDSDDPYVGTTISDRYVVDALIGEGGMGRVYLAHHKVIGKQVAIKILHSELAKDKEAVGRFVREAKAASSIGNAHIVDISDFGETKDGSTYFVMEYLGGEALADLMEDRGALPMDLVCEIALQMCDGLAAAHSKDIIHRDLKPDNIHIVTQGKQENFVKLLDFGIAKVSTSTSSTKLTMAGAVFGTPHYMSPEQAAGAAVDHRTDIYSLGVMLYEMVSGQLPFNADNFMGILTQHMYKAPVPIRAVVGAPECTPGLEALILKCLSKKPDARYQTMGELAEDIRRYQGDGIPNAVHEMMARSGNFNVPADYFKGPTIVQAAPMGPRKRMGPRYVAIAGVAVAVIVVLFVLMRDSTTTAQPPQASGTPTPTAADPAPTANTPEPGVMTTDVLVYAEPADAVAMVEGKEYKLPETFAVPDGKKLTVVVRYEGYEEQTVEIDESKDKHLVKLVKAAPGAGVRPRPRPRPRPGGKKNGDVVDPWGN